MRDRTKIQVKNMEISHVKNVLKMLIRKYTMFCITAGAKKCCSLDIDTMVETDVRTMLDLTCEDRLYLKRLVSTECFGRDIYSEIMTPIKDNDT